jgi:hypothetical protein
MGVPRKRLEYKQEEEENPRICSYTVGFNASDPLLKQATTYLFFFQMQEEENPRICSYTVGFNASDPLLKQATAYLFLFQMQVFWPLVFSYFRFYVAEWLLESVVIINKCKRVYVHKYNF